VQEIGVNPFKSNEIEISKGYDNTKHWSVVLNQKDLIKRYLKEAELETEERKGLSSFETIQELSTELEEKEDLTSGANQLLKKLQEEFPNGFDKRIYALLSERLPNFVFFREYDKLPGRISIDDLIKRQKENSLKFGDKIFLALLNLANSSPEEINEIGQSEQLIMELEAISNRLTEEIFEYWSQNRHLDVQFRFDAARPNDPVPFNSGYVFSTRILNQRHKATVNFDERSSGFIWFFSFLIWFSQIKKNYGENVFILLDEPGLSLHGTAQNDLLRYINEKLRPNYQVIYTTHSPFMLDPVNVFSIRTVEDVVIKENGNEKILGTKVGQKILSRDKDTLLPLQGIAGFDII
jgi:predicted ATP-dependent endonuclease of OLD family